MTHTIAPVIPLPPQAARTPRHRRRGYWKAVPTPDQAAAADTLWAVRAAFLAAHAAEPFPGMPGLPPLAP